MIWFWGDHGWIQYASPSILVLHPKLLLSDVELSDHFWVMQPRRKTGCMVSFLFHLTIKSVFEAPDKSNDGFTFTFNGHSLPPSLSLPVSLSVSVCLLSLSVSLWRTQRFDWPFVFSQKWWNVTGWLDGTVHHLEFLNINEMSVWTDDVVWWSFASSRTLPTDTWDFFNQVYQITTNNPKGTNNTMNA